jgi:RNA polymerase sigma-70 factor (ECF subfamily)
LEITDPQVYGRFVREYGERAFRFAYRLTGNAEDAKDLVQEAFYRMIRSWDRYEESRSLDAWFFTIMRNIHLDLCKRYEKGRLVSLQEKPSGDGGGTYEEIVPSEEEAVLRRLEREEALGEVRSALRGLSPEHRSVLALCDMEDLSYARASEVSGIPVGTVRSRLSRAREALRRALAGGREARA